MSELRLEKLMIGKEATAGTAIHPTDVLNVSGRLRPEFDVYVPEEYRGLTPKRYRSAVTKEWGTFEGDGGLDLEVLPLLMQGFLTGTLGSQPTTPTNGSLTRLWTLAPDIDGDDRARYSVYWGDSNVQVFEGTFGVLENLSVTGDADGGDGTQMSFNGFTQVPGWQIWTGDITAITAAASAIVSSTVVSAYLEIGDVVRFSGVVGMTEINDLIGTITAITSGTEFTVDIDSSGFTAYTSGGEIDYVSPVAPAMTEAPLISPVNIDVYLDETTIETTLLSGKVLAVSHSLDLDWGRKYTAAGKTAEKTYSRVGYGGHMMTTTLTMELDNMEQYEMMQNAADVKCRVYHYGPLIESVTPDYYYYLMVDTYGPLRFADFGEAAGTNRTVQFTIESEYDSAAGHDFQMAVQCQRTS